ncbi:hypothetical protein GCM10010320_80880 [Streptomyces caelestis]|nr:hypothetical protein GCM10010320_80880 [Streptomyces caelestis]
MISLAGSCGAGLNGPAAARGAPARLGSAFAQAVISHAAVITATNARARRRPNPIDGVIMHFLPGMDMSSW